MLEGINIDHNGQKNREYAKCREAFKTSKLSPEDIQLAKQAVIDLLGGTIHKGLREGLRDFVEFKDGTKAVY